MLASLSRSRRQAQGFGQQPCYSVLTMGRDNYRVGFRLLAALLVANLVMLGIAFAFWRDRLTFFIAVCVILFLIDVIAVSLSFASDDRERML